MAAEIVPVDPSDRATLGAVVRLIAEQQRRPERHVIYVGTEEDGIRAELDELQPPWTATLRVVRDEGRVVAAALVEWDEGSGRAWLFGPWIDGDDDVWARWARPLVDALTAQLPATVAARELSGTLANERLRELAAELGWPPTEVNLVYTVDAATVAAWPPMPDDGLRDAVREDLAAIVPLHEAEFPASYFSAPQLVERAAGGEQTVVVAVGDDGRPAGYAAGRVQPDGNGYLDFVAVSPDARGTGAGRRLVSGVVRRVLPAATTGELHLTVQEHRAPARALYEALGFRLDVAFVAYRAPAA